MPGALRLLHLRIEPVIKTPHRKRSEFIIGGWLPGIGVNRHTVGAPIVGAYSVDEQLRFCGVVGAGLSNAERRRLTKSLEPLQRSTSPFTNVPSDIAPHARWVHAELVGDVEYREFACDADASLVEGTAARRGQRPGHPARLACRPVGAWGRHLVKRVNSTCVGPHQD